MKFVIFSFHRSFSFYNIILFEGSIEMSQFASLKSKSLLEKNVPILELFNRFYWVQIHYCVLKSIMSKNSMK